MGYTVAFGTSGIVGITELYPLVYDNTDDGATLPTQRNDEDGAFAIVLRGSNGTGDTYTINLPASPKVGMVYKFKNLADVITGTAKTRAITIAAPSGVNIDGEDDDLITDDENETWEMIYFGTVDGVDLGWVVI